MEDLASKLQSILSSPEGQEQLRNIAGMLGMDSKTATPPPPPADTPTGVTPDLSGLLRALSGNPSPDPPTVSPSSSEGQTSGGGSDLSALMGLLSSGSGATSTTDSAGGLDLGGIDINQILKLQQIFRSMNGNDKNSQLLLALKPHFGERRRARVDQAIRIIRLISMLPALRESGLFAGL